MTTIDVPVDCPPCGQPFRVQVPVTIRDRSLVVDTERLAHAVRAHVRQHA